jgi:hypothetical protein
MLVFLTDLKVDLSPQLVLLASLLLIASNKAGRWRKVYTAGGATCGSIALGTRDPAKLPDIELAASRWAFHSL